MSALNPLPVTARRPGPETLYQQVAVRISELIQHGTLRPGERVPSVRQYSRQQNVSIATVTQAYRLLEDRGLLQARPQSGYYVRPQRWATPPEPGISKPAPRAVEVQVSELVMEVVKASRDLKLVRLGTTPPEPGISKPAPRAVEVQVSELVMEVVKASRDQKLVRLGTTLPSPELFPFQALHRTLAAVGRRSPTAANSYEAPPGNLALRIQIARRAMDAGCTLAPDDIVTTIGATEALNLCLRAVARPGDVIAIESPSFFGILQIIESLGMRVCEIPTFPREGVCLDELAARLKTCRIKACVFTPNFSNPLGSRMPDEKKRKLVRLLSEHEVPLIEDDIYGNLSFDETRPKVAKAYDTDGWVMLCDSFTKTLCPGYRVGWVAPGRFRAKVEFLKFVNTSASPSLPQMAIAEFLQNGGYDHHLRKIRRFYAAQMQQMSEAITRYFPSGTRLTRPTGGMCLWVELPPSVDALKLYRVALGAGISLAPGPLFSAKQKFENFIRINCGNPWTDPLENAVRTLGKLIEQLANKGSGKAPARDRGRDSELLTEAICE